MLQHTQDGSCGTLPSSMNSRLQCTPAWCLGRPGNPRLLAWEHGLACRDASLACRRPYWPDKPTLLVPDPCPGLPFPLLLPHLQALQALAPCCAPLTWQHGAAASTELLQYNCPSQQAPSGTAAGRRHLQPPHLAAQPGSVHQAAAAHPLHIHHSRIAPADAAGVYAPARAAGSSTVQH